MGVTKACHVELDGLEADLVGKVSSKQTKPVFRCREAGPSLVSGKVGVPANASPTGVAGGNSNGLPLKEAQRCAKGTPLIWEWA